MPFNWNPFGAEYAWRPTWSHLERFYIKSFGVVDFPSRIRARLVVREVRQLRFNNLLDFGCGAGTYSFYFSRQSDKNVESIDVDESRIVDCKAIKNRLNRHNVRFHLADNHDGLQRFNDESFDAALAIEVFQYVPNLRFTLANLRRLLKPGGLLIGHIPVLGYLRETEYTLFNDNNIRQFINESGFELVRLSSTFGGVIRGLCNIFERIVGNKFITAVVYPFLLAASAPFKVESAEGDYRFFVARKPMYSEDRK